MNVSRRARSLALVSSVVVALVVPAAAANASPAVGSHGAAVTAAPSTRGAAAPRVALHGRQVTIERDTDYRVELSALGSTTWAVSPGDDVTGWFVTADGVPAFAPSDGVAVAQRSGRSTLTVTIDAGAIEAFATNGPAAIYAQVPASALLVAGQTPSRAPAAVRVGRYVIPRLTVDSDIFGSAFTASKSTLKSDFGIDVGYDPDTSATLTLSLAGLRDSKIDASAAAVAMVDGDGYYASEFLFSGTALTGAWHHGATQYALQAGDIVIDTDGYLISDTNSGREWSCLGGDGQGNYHFTLEVSGITYNGLPVATSTFGAYVKIYGQDYGGGADELYGSGIVVDPVIAPLSTKVADPPGPGTVPVWTWVGAGDLPNLVDHVADDVYVTWPTRVDASKVTQDDVTVTLSNALGDSKVLVPGTDYVVSSSAGETQVAITAINWSFTPVFTTLTVAVDRTSLKHAGGLAAATLQASYDAVSVYVYEAQQGGGGTTIDGTVTAYSFYGFTNLESWQQLMSPATYTLVATVADQTVYYAEDAGGTPYLASEAAEATVFDGSGVADRNIQLIGNSLYITRRMGQTVTTDVAGTPVTFDKVYAGGRLLAPTAADPGLRAAPGYVIPWGTSNWITHEKWAWQQAVDVGWTGIEVTPWTGRFEWEVARGTTEQFYAADPSVTWGLVGPHVDGTSISATGLLTVAADETSTQFAVVATSTTDLSLDGKGAVAIKVTD
ncbi:hypothetical protein OEB99_08755 [Actinotalea sp. M2MS4P-6]|uniref:hypothetical protein n=1 Tax=Actinotalea sp. M2MS4P-6 TaxID=2983762 RepID=UPI0021E376B2|nr:hypothetical protein [Actinotalea sp. M2MS4P-6]MCV2394398.1 hypothetical protein [Actinotalea sp. M2MS4P-6]